MSEAKVLTQKQKYLQHIVPALDDSQIDRMIAAALAKEKKNSPALPKQENDSYAELMAMIGCHDAKKQLTAMIAQHRMKKLAESRGRAYPHAYYHAVFSGNPGSAKTTCARLFAKALANEGITKSNRFAELSRSAIIGKYQGHTAAKVHELFERNAGGVIFIDEAYSLDDGKDSPQATYGEEAINEIIVCLENHPDTVVIFAGYPDKMKAFLECNPGLSSRVPYRVTFEDYTVEELIAISKVIAKEQGYDIAPSAIDKLSHIYEEAKNQADFGNGRFVRNTVEAAVRRKGINLGIMDAQNLENLMDCEKYSDEVLFSLDESCFEAQSAPRQEQARKIGFFG